MDIYTDLLSIDFNLLSVLLNQAHHSISDFEIYFACKSNNVIAKYIVLSNIIIVVSDNILRICIPGTPLDIKKIVVFLHALSAYNN